MELPARSSTRGRPNRFHNATCRQRAHRAALAVRHQELLSTLVTIESALSEIRRSVLSGQELPSDAGRHLSEATNEALRQINEVTALPVAADTDAKRPATSAQRIDVSPVVPRVVTESVTEKGGAKAKPPRHVASAARSRRPRPKPLDLDSVRLERREEPESGWRVLAGSDEAPTVVGFLEPVFSGSTGRRSGRWLAVTPQLTKLPGGPWRNRTDATVRLLDSYQRAAAR
ncbi:hypothetical protein [Pseudonocardia spinosispora]|uniref:hypothetical protein n=1 Tax=Pseudonocardia spinosispora TaxID=103441 RepID=UPI0012EBD673|nr:hypothetical protein [Pseudonocardia spinosispora]